MTATEGPADIFVSHSSANKPEVGAIVSELKAILARLNRPMTVFIDRPKEIDGLNPADMHIPVNADWEQTLDRQLAGCSVTIVFWSGASLKSDWVQKEAERSYVDMSADDVPKLFHVTLDQAGADHHGRMFLVRKTQACRLHALDGDPGKRTGAIGELATAIVSYVQKPRKEKPSLKAPVEVLPYLIDCREQVRALNTAISLIFEPKPVDGDGPPDAGKRPPRPVFAVASVRDDGPENLLSRLAKHDLPTLCKGMQLPPDRLPETNYDGVRWLRDGRKPGAAMRKAIEKAVRSLGTRRKRIMLFATTIEAPQQRDLELLDDWLAGWDDAFSSVEEAADAGALPLLVVIDNNGWFASTTAIGDAILEKVDAFVGKQTRGVNLDRLGTLTSIDASQWRDEFLPLGRDHNLHMGVGKFIRSQFAKPGKEPRLEQFASRMVQQPWWQDLKRYYGG